MSAFNLRPGVSNPNQWQPEGRKRAVPERVRKIVLIRDDYTCMSCGHKATKWMNIHHLQDGGDDELSNLATLCPPCHAVMHLGLNMMHGAVEVWRSSLRQVDIVRKTREGVRDGRTLDEIKAAFDLKKGRFAPGSESWIKDLMSEMGPEPRAELPEPLCAVFVKFKQWQIDV